MKKRINLGLCILALVLIGSLLLTGCSAGKTVPVPVPAPASSEGIKVHGHWTIEVRNPDGTLAERREFDNILGPTGAETLVNLLGRRNSVGGWHIRLSATSAADNAFLDGSSNPSYGAITESTDPGTAPAPG